MERKAIKEDIMKVVCVTNIPYGRRGDSYSDITPGKIYQLENEAGNLFKDKRRSVIWIQNDTGGRSWYSKDMFISLEEWRERQLKKIL